jgi:hypothetical protein
MGLFSAFVKTVINVATLPVAVGEDVLEVLVGQPENTIHTKEKLEQIKKESE